MSKKTHAVLALTMAVPMLAATTQAATLRVPQDRSTIQAAIDAAVDGDTVLVAPGAYRESIDFNGKAITVTSSDGAKTTIIDAERKDSVARFHSGETRASVLSGFTLQNGGAVFEGGGVQINQASPMIRGNTVRNNSACGGNGIVANFSAALIVDNHIHHNHHDGCGGGSPGGGILIGGVGEVEVTDNLIEHNQAYADGGGIGLFAAGQPLIARNTIRFNSSGNWGGGVSTTNDSNPTFINNAVYGNASSTGGGIALSVPYKVQGGYWVNNTIANNTADQGSELFIGGFASQVQLANNIFFTSQGTSSVFCDDVYDRVSPIFLSNDVYATNGATIGGICAAGAGTKGNLAVDPLFDITAKGVKAYALTADSTAIDAGAKAREPGDTDLLGHKRRVDGNGDGRKVIDLGAIEYRAH
jgi:hypothetical protein